MHSPSGNTNGLIGGTVLSTASVSGTLTNVSLTVALSSCLTAAGAGINSSSRWPNRRLHCLLSAAAVQAVLFYLLVLSVFWWAQGIWM